MRAAVVAMALLALAVAGCASPPPGNPGASLPVPVPVPLFGAPQILDPVRSGGEPVIFVTPKGTLLIAAHPGLTHTKAPPGPEEILPLSGQSYLFRSSDGGATWQPATGPGGPNTPRNTALGVSDPDLASNDDGSLLVMADLGVVAITSAASQDDGATWPRATTSGTNPRDGNVDRPWLAQSQGNFFLLYNGDGNGHWRLRQSTDGVTWNDFSTPGDGSYPGAMAAGPDGSLYIGNGDKVWSSTDGGKTFTASKIPGQKPMTGITAQRPAVDAAGTVYFAWSEFSGIYYAASHDHGATWGPAIKLAEGGTNIWPWPAAGAAGKLVVVWVHADEANPDPSAVTGTWTVHAAFVEDAGAAQPRLWTGEVPGAKVHEGGICIDGTLCEAEGKDRRLGDFITVALDAAGAMHIAYGTTTTGHSISSPAYVRQV